MLACSLHGQQAQFNPRGEALEGRRAAGAMDWYRSAAEQGNGMTMVNIGAAYLRSYLGVGLRTRLRSPSWFRRMPSV